jgi:PTS system mannose-specific IIB component
LVRIDDRLLHGQVLLGWAASFAPQRIILANDDVAADAERAGFYASLAEGEYEIDVLSVATAAEWLGQDSGARTLYVVGSAADALRLVELGAELDQINVGGMHHAEGKKRLLDYVYLSERDASNLRALLARGVGLEARDLPGARASQIDHDALAGLWP